MEGFMPIIIACIETDEATLDPATLFLYDLRVIVAKR